VVSGESEVLIAVKEIESSELALDSCDMKLDMFPPGQAATNIIPIATIGVIRSFRMITSRNVSAGKSIIWQIAPSITDLGFLKISLNTEGLMPSATPYITNASTKLIKSIPALEKLILTGSRFNSCSYIFFAVKIRCKLEKKV